MILALPARSAARGSAAVKEAVRSLKGHFETDKRVITKEATAATASADDPALATMVHPDFTKTLEFLDAGGYVPPLHLRPGAQTAQLMWAQQFRGEAIHLTSFIDADATSTPPQLAERKVTTQAQ